MRNSTTLGLCVSAAVGVTIGIPAGLILWLLLLILLGSVAVNFINRTD